MLDRLLRDALARITMRRRSHTPSAGEPADPYVAPPTIEDLEAAGITWEPLDDDEASGLEIARDNGYVVLRDPQAPGRPPLILDETEWSAALNGDDTDGSGRDWLL